MMGISEIKNNILRRSILILLLAGLLVIIPAFILVLFVIFACIELVCAILRFYDEIKPDAIETIGFFKREFRRLWKIQD